MIKVNLIRQLCQSRGISQKVLAESACISPQYLTDILARRRNPSIDTLYHIAVCLGADPRDLLTSALPDGDRRQGRELISVCFVLDEGGDVMNQVQVRKPDVVTFFNVRAGADYDDLKAQMLAAVEEALSKLVRPIVQPAGGGGA